MPLLAYAVCSFFISLCAIDFRTFVVGVLFIAIRYIWGNYDRSKRINITVTVYAYVMERLGDTRTRIKGTSTVLLCMSQFRLMKMTFWWIQLHQNANCIRMIFSKWIRRASHNTIHESVAFSGLWGRLEAHRGAGNTKSPVLLLLIAVAHWACDRLKLVRPPASSGALFFASDRRVGSSCRRTLLVWSLSLLYIIVHVQPPPSTLPFY